MHYAKLATTVIGWIAIATAAYFFMPENTSIAWTNSHDWNKTLDQAILKAEKDLYEARYNKSRSKWDECFQKETSKTWASFETQQRSAYECWKSWTAHLTPVSEVPKWIITTVNAAEQSAKKPQKKSTENVGKSSKEGNEYWKAYEQAIKQIQKWEWLRLKAYPDGNRCSIGYGSPAKSCSERISIQEANKRLASTVRKLTDTVVGKYPNLSPKGKGALISFGYNCWGWFQSVMKNGLSYHSKWCKYSKTSPNASTGLKKRRAEEALFIFQ